MASLPKLPVELILIILSRLKTPNANTELLRLENRRAILPLSQTNRALWSIARPFLYHDIEILMDTGHYVVPDLYNLYLQTSLLYRSLQEDPSLTSHVQTLEVLGLLTVYYSDVLAIGKGPARHSNSPLNLTASTVATLLTSFTNVRRFKVGGNLIPDISHKKNQIILSCMKSMTKLEEFELYAGHLETRVNPIIHFLNAASTRLKTLIIGPFLNGSPRFIIWPVDTDPIPNPRSKLLSLQIHTGQLPLAAFRSWTSDLQELTISDIAISDDGQTTQGPTINYILAPIASTLRYLRLGINGEYFKPSIFDFDLSQCPVLEIFMYEGPWWIKSTDLPIHVQQILLSKSYQLFDVKLWVSDQEGELESLPVLKEAFNIAHEQNCSPVQFNLALLHSGLRIHPYSYFHEKKANIRRWMQDLFEKGIDVKWGLAFPKDQDQETSESEFTHDETEDEENRQIED
jgi:hypothetical protein